MSDISGAQPPVRVVAANHPFKPPNVDITVSAGMSIAEIFACVQPDPFLRSYAHVYLGPHYIKPEYWASVRPKAGTVLAIRAFLPPEGGSGGKAILRNVLLIAVAASAIAFGPELGAALGLSGALAASAGNAIIGIGGMLLVNTLVPPPSTTSANSASDSQTNFIEGGSNTARPFEVVPVLFGRRRVIPDLAAEWITEIVGDQQYLRGILNWGIGPLNWDDADLKLGDTPLSNFTDYQLEHRYGYPGDAPLTLYPNATDQQNFQISLLETDGYNTRTSALNADEIGIDFFFTEGLISVANDGTRSSRSVTVELEYSVAGANSWNNIPVAGGAQTFALSSTNQSGGSYNNITFTGKTTSALRHGLTFKTPARGAYDIRIKRLTADASSDTIRDLVTWAVLRTITNESPLKSLVPIAVTAIRIKATDQLTGVIDNLSGIPNRICPDYDADSDTWITRETRNPASALRFALQGNGIQVLYADANIDLDFLAYWHTYCDTHSFEYNENRDFSSTLGDLLQDIASAGRASPQNINGKWSVVIDEPKTPVQHVTPRNSLNFKAVKAFIDAPDAIRVQFNNEEQDYNNDEVIVYLNGNTADTAALFETMSFAGQTSPTQNAVSARFAANSAILRPEQWTFDQDMERLVYRRGDVILITHDVLLVGLAYGRIKSVVLDGDGNALGATVDEALFMDDFVSYGMSIRTPGNVAVTTQVVAVSGGVKTVSFVTPIDAADAPNAGDLFGFGLLGEETDFALVLAIEPAQTLTGFNATITCCPYRDELYTLDADDVPEFDTNLTPIAPVPDVAIVQTRSDETALTVGAGNSLIVHVAVKVTPINDPTAKLEIQIRPSATDGATFAEAQIDASANNEYFVGDVRTGESVDLQMRWTVAGRIPGRWTAVFNYFVVGKSTNPEALQNATLATFGGQAFIRWDEPPELDVVFGGEVRFRHSTDPAPTWGNSISIGNVARAKSLIATLPLKPGTYLARVFDDSGNQSDTVSIDTKQASVLTYAPVDSLDEAPSFSGTKMFVDTDGTDLFLVAAGQVDEMTDVDSVPDWDGFGAGEAVTDTGEYDFASGFDFLTVQNIRLTTRVNVAIGSVSDNIDSWVGDIDARDDFDGTDTALADCTVYVSTTDDDPGGGSPSWTDWQRLDSMEINARGCRFKAILTSQNPDFNIFVNTLGIDAEQVT